MMIKKLMLLAVVAATPALICAAIPSAVPLVSEGSVDRLRVYSPHMADTVTVDVWMPRQYDASKSRKFPVIYMHDGQNLFDPEVTWNHQSWEIDSVASLLASDGAICPPVVVGVHSVAETRLGDLMPQKAFENIADLDSLAPKNGFFNPVVRGDAYAAFIVNTLRPLVNSRYNVSHSADSTFVMGSSMGGLMSVYMLCEYPEVFGGAGCLSTHWVGTLDGDTTFADAMYKYLDDNLPTDNRHLLYFDRGTETIDSHYGSADERMISLCRQKGYKDGVTLDTFVDQGAAHEERFWARRVERPLRFLLHRK